MVAYIDLSLLICFFQNISQRSCSVPLLGAAIDAREMRTAALTPGFHRTHTAVPCLHFDWAR